jgi:hypothetical protein
VAARWRGAAKRALPCPRPVRQIAWRQTGIAMLCRFDAREGSSDATAASCQGRDDTDVTGGRADTVRRDFPLMVRMGGSGAKSEPVASCLIRPSRISLAPALSRGLAGGGATRGEKASGGKNKAGAKHLHDYQWLQSSPAACSSGFTPTLVQPEAQVGVNPDLQAAPHGTNRQAVQPLPHPTTDSALWRDRIPTPAP